MISNDSDLVYYLSYAVTFAGIIQFIFLIIFTRKYFYPDFNFNFQIDKKINFFLGNFYQAYFHPGLLK